MKLPHTEDVPEELYDAARVSAFMDEGDVGRWRLRHFTVTDEEYRHKIYEIRYSSSPERADHEMGRAVPPGDYITLQRRMTDKEKRDAFHEAFGHTPEEAVSAPNFKDSITAEDLLDHAFDKNDRAWIPIMSDTPAEILEHAHALNRASGQVLITGLGLGCLPHALLTKPEVAAIHIVEIDPDVIELTGPYLMERARDAGVEVVIHRGSALAIPTLFDKGTQFDYVWHDIWSHISSKNLRDETAEHGISYGRLLDICAEHLDVGETDAWALEQAIEMDRILTDEQAREDAFVRKLRAASLDEQVRLLRDRVLRSRIRTGERDLFPEDQPIPPEIERVMDPTGELESHIREQLQRPDFWEGWARRRDERDERDYLDHPNRHLEEAGAADPLPEYHYDNEGHAIHDA